MKNFQFLLLKMLILSLIMASCGSARKSVPISNPLNNESIDVTKGRAVFMDYCQACHPHGEAGLGFALNNKPLPGFLIRFQVRQGLGAMPSFKEDVISDEALGQIVAYLKALRKNDK